MGQDKIAIFPAAGALGTSVYRHVLKLLPPEQVVLITRNPQKIPEEIVAAGVEVRKADYNVPDSFDHVFDGVSYLFLISYPSIEIDRRFQAHKKAITTALHSRPGVKHVFYTSLGFAQADHSTSAAHVMQAHLRTEEWLKSLTKDEPTLTFTAIRQGIYAESYPIGSGPGVAWVAIDDLGEANAKMIKDCLSNPQDDRYHNAIILLSGPRAYSLKETVDILGRCAGKEVAIEQVSFDEHAQNAVVVENLNSHGPGDASRDWTSVFEAISNGETAVVSGDLERYLGRPAEDFETTVKRVMAS